MSKTTIKIDDKYKAEVDDLNHTLMQYSEGGEEITVGKFAGQKSKPKWSVIGYYPNLQQCLRKVISLESLDGGESSLQAFVERLEALDAKYYRES